MHALLPQARMRRWLFRQCLRAGLHLALTTWMHQH